VGQDLRLCRAPEWHDKRQWSDTVNMHERFVPYDIGVGASGGPLRRDLLARVAGWMKGCADYYAAAVAYEELSRLSDAELRRRGLSRDILARDL
jgi:hypothetical protein